MRVYLDDVREPYEGWVLVKTAEEVITLLRAGSVAQLSLDHDLGMRETSPGIFVEVEAFDGTWLVKSMIREGLWPTEKPLVHSANPPAAKRMRDLIDAFFGKKEENI